MTKKNVLDSAVRWEILNNLYEVLPVLKQLGFIKHNYPLTESSAWCWLEDEPNTKDKKKFLKQMGYEF